MRFSDLIRLALEALLRRKARTALTLVGVVVGASLLVISLAVGRGVRTALENQFDRGGRMLRINVYPGRPEADEVLPEEEVAVEGDVSDERRERLRKQLVDRHPAAWRRPPLKALTSDRIRELSELEHVVLAWPDLRESWKLAFDEPTAVDEDGRTDWARTIGVPAEIPEIKDLIVGGRMFLSDDEQGVLVHEYHVYNWGFQDDADVENVLGHKVKIENHRPEHSMSAILDRFSGAELSLSEKLMLTGVVTQLPTLVDELNVDDAVKELLKKVFTPKPPEEDAPEYPVIERELPIVGVYRSPTDEEWSSLPYGWSFDHSSLLLPIDVAHDMWLEQPDAGEQGVDTVMLQVDSKEHVRAVVDAVTELGYRNHSMVEFVERVLEHVAFITWSLSGFAAAALLVSAIGITNTMVMSVLERVREIGVMKAVGARDGQILSVFLIEGLLLGLVGGLTGVLLGWGVSMGLDAWVRSILEAEFQDKVEDAMFVFPVWVTFGVPLFCAATTVLASFYPARQASRVDPVTALRHD